MVQESGCFRVVESTIDEDQMAAIRAKTVANQSSGCIGPKDNQSAQTTIKLINKASEVIALVQGQCLFQGQKIFMGLNGPNVARSQTGSVINLFWNAYSQLLEGVRNFPAIKAAGTPIKEEEKKVAPKTKQKIKSIH